MFGMGFMEIFLVLIVAIIALGPEKLPGAAVEIVKFFRKFKSGIEDAKSTLDSEINLSEMKKEADEFRSSVSNIKNITSLEMQELSTTLEESTKIPENQNTQTPTPKKEESSKKAQISLDDEKVN